MAVKAGRPCFVTTVLIPYIDWRLIGVGGFTNRDTIAIRLAIF
jgi:hypothetical protein